MSPETKERLRSIPSVATMLEHEEVRGWLGGLPRSVVVVAVQDALGELREAIIQGDTEAACDEDAVIARAEELVLGESLPSLRRVINATGIVLHTGLGRAPLCEAAIDAIVEGASGYCNIELQLDTGERGRRVEHVAHLLARLTGAEAATVVNNNAAATLIILQTLATGKEVIVSRGQLIEIGGSFRLPEIMSAGGTILREVGTTNRTRVADYAGAIGDQTAILMHVHTSNYRVVGFVEQPSVAEIADLARRFDLIAVDDLGSGALIDLSVRGLPAEPTPRASLDAGAHLVCFSGDKLLGGPQCGVIAGCRELIEQIEANPLMRTYRVGKLTLLALEATLRHYGSADDAIDAIPTLAMLCEPADELAARAGALCERLQTALPGEDFLVCSDVGYAGGGTMPTEPLETVVVVWRPTRASAQQTATALRTSEVPVVARIRDDAICFDVRTVPEHELDDLVASIAAAAAGE